MQIKIRAWDKDSETMIYGVGITPESDGGIPYQIPVNAHDFDQFDYYPNSIIMLYTGLKDKNGTEIYEGDVIRDNDGFLWVVYFEDGMYCAKGGEYETVEYLIEFCPEWCEVIGNIYEHPHLLGSGEK
ncbi:YopX family protein [Geobacillus thermoleovorans]|uniref:YopX family protein n=1 Tax=Geobacillus thermoleovorans TaxID=33941 RepID=UPI0009F4AFB7|nr:YopX family protein [Geobacillus thermoleovorans]